MTVVAGILGAFSRTLAEPTGAPALRSLVWSTRHPFSRNLVHSFAAAGEDRNRRASTPVKGRRLSILEGKPPEIPRVISRTPLV
ncbi:MAG: hypothetical protein U0790_29160 [Isosphaeraceae bacterium]